MPTKQRICPHPITLLTKPMAFNWQTFQIRALSAVVFVIIMAAGLLWNEWSFLVLFSIIHFGCWVEYLKLVKAIHKQEAPFPFLFTAGLISFGWGVLLLFSGPLQLWERSMSYMGSILCVMSAVLLIAGAWLMVKNNHGRRVIAAMAGLFYISLSLALLIQLRTKNDYTNTSYALTIPLLVIANNWVNDTMAYIVGSLIGKTPFSPISPKKTWEGTIGGVVLAVVVISLIAYLGGLLPLHHAAALSLIGAVTGTYGDLFESKLKRMAGVKDSGTMMPGHGGFLDRFDSLLFSATACAVYVAIAMN